MPSHWCDWLTLLFLIVESFCSRWLLRLWRGHHGRLCHQVLVRASLASAIDLKCAGHSHAIAPCTLPLEAPDLLGLHLLTLRWRKFCPSSYAHGTRNRRCSGLWSSFCSVRVTSCGPTCPWPFSTSRSTSSGARWSAASSGFWVMDSQWHHHSRCLPWSILQWSAFSSGRLRSSEVFLVPFSAAFPQLRRRDVPWFHRSSRWSLSSRWRLVPSGRTRWNCCPLSFAWRCAWTCFWQTGIA